LKEFRSNSKIRKGNRYSSYVDATKSGHLNLHKDFTRTFRPWNQKSREQNFKKNWDEENNPKATINGQYIYA
jgi:hypothetical protein